MRKSKFRARVVEFVTSEVNTMKTSALTLLLAAAVGIAACQTGRQTPPPPAPQPDPGTGTAQPQPNPNPAPPSPPLPTPVANVSAASAASASAPPPAAAIPDQPVVATVAVASEAPARPHEDILELKRAGLSDELILKRVRSENVNYQLTTADVVELRTAGLSEAILEAMLRSGQAQPSARH
jgi:hypothetical protein